MRYLRTRYNVTLKHYTDLTLKFTVLFRWTGWFDIWAWITYPHWVIAAGDNVFYDSTTDNWWRKIWTRMNGLTVDIYGVNVGFWSRFGSTEEKLAEWKDMSRQQIGWLWRTCRLSSTSRIVWRVSYVFGSSTILNVRGTLPSIVDCWDSSGCCKNRNYFERLYLCK